MFDLDGTLADSLGDLANATNAALAALGCPTHPREKYRVLVGDGARVLCERALPAERRDLVEETLRRMRTHYDAHCFDETRLYPGIAELVTALHRRKYRLAVLSNKPDVFTKRMIEHYFQPNPFDAVVGHRAEVPLKPDPASALAIARQLDVPAKEWLYLGDTNTDMQTAKNAGLRAVGVTWGFRDREELVGSGAEVIVTAPDQVLQLL